MVLTSLNPSADHPGLHALVIEDDAVSRRVIELVLESKGMTADFATNGSEGLEAFVRGSFDVVLMDLQMPAMNGYDAIRGIRAVEAAGPTPRTPVVVVSAYTRAGDVALAVAAGADRHLGKPLDVRLLLGTIEELTS